MSRNIARSPTLKHNRGLGWFFSQLLCIIFADSMLVSSQNPRPLLDFGASQEIPIIISIYSHSTHALLISAQLEPESRRKQGSNKSDYYYFTL